MKIKDFLNSIVLDKNANEVGKVDNVDFNIETGKIENIILTLKKNIFTNDELEISFDDVEAIGAYVLLNKVVPKEESDVNKSTTVEVDDE